MVIGLVVGVNRQQGVRNDYPQYSTDRACTKHRTNKAGCSNSGQYDLHYSDSSLAGEEYVRAFFMRLMGVYNTPVRLSQLALKNPARLRRIISLGMLFQRSPSISA